MLLVGHGSRSAAGRAEILRLADLVADRATGLVVEVGFLELSEPPARAPPATSPVGLLVRAIADSFLAARLRLGPGAVMGGVWAFSSAATTGRLLANTSGL